MGSWAGWSLEAVDLVVHKWPGLGPLRPLGTLPACLAVGLLGFHPECASSLPEAALGLCVFALSGIEHGPWGNWDTMSRATSLLLRWLSMPCFSGPPALRVLKEMAATHTAYKLWKSSGCSFFVGVLKYDQKPKKANLNIKGILPFQNIFWGWTEHAFPYLYNGGVQAPLFLLVYLIIVLYSHHWIS